MNMFTQLYPGIRAKFSFFTAFFAITLIAFISLMYLNQEYKALKESFDREIQPLRFYTERIVLDLENISSGFILIEDFRIRLQNKQKELSKYRIKRTQVVDKKNWFTKNVLGKLNYLKNDLVDIQDKTKVSYQSTYFSEYITEKKIKEIEDNMRFQLKDSKGNFISEERFKKIQTIANSIVVQKNEIEKLREDLSTLETQSNELKENSKKGIPFKQEDLKTLSQKIELQNIKIQNKENKINLSNESLNQEILNFSHETLKANIKELNLNTQLIRIQSFDIKDIVPNFDTSIFANPNILNSQSFISHPTITGDLEDKTENLNINKLINMDFLPTQLIIQEKEYESHFKPILKRPTIFNRAIIIQKAIKEDSSNWKDFIEKDKELCKEFANTSQKLKDRLATLRNLKSVKPSSDSEFIQLYKYYSELLKKREGMIRDLKKSKDISIANIETLQTKKNELSNKMINLQLEYKKLETSYKNETDEKVQNQIEQDLYKYSRQIEDLKNEIAYIQSIMEDWNEAKNLLVIDALENLRNAALFEYSILRFQYNPSIYREFISSEKNRELSIQKWSSLRNWIMKGSSETQVDTILINSKQINIFEGGILWRSRSEIEEEMWKLDATPISSINLNDNSNLSSQLLLQEIYGFTRTIIDKSEGLEKIHKDLRNILYYTSIIGILSTILAFAVSSFMVRNIRRLSAKAKLVGKGNLNVVFNINTKDEIGMLSETLNNMIYGLIERDKVKSALGKFVNPEIAEMVLKKELKLGGEKKECAIFFSDIRGFTSISESLAPEEVVEFLNEYMTEMVRCVNTTNGVVDKFIGDAIMATWGAAYTKGDNPENAVNAALLMRKALQKFNEGRGTNKKPFIRIGCGINYGSVIAGQIGSEERLEYTVIGDAVNLASRVESLNKPFGTDILITQELYERVKEIYTVEKMQTIKVKGKTDPQTIYAVLGRKDDPNCPKSLVELQNILGIEVNNKEIFSTEEEKKYEILS